MKVKLFVIMLLGFCFSLLTLPSRGTPSAYAQDSTQIVGGEDASADAYPWMVAVGNPSGNGIVQWCGGSLIHPEWVLTAAHCMEGETASGLRVVIGMHRRSNSDTEGVRRGITQIINHPNYNGSTYDNDIALLKLDAPVNNVELVLPAFSADTNLNAPGKMATVMGWGVLQSGGNQPDVLQHVDVPLVSNETCNAPQSYNGSITNTMICAGFAQGGKDACQNDSGGPLVVRDDQNRWRQVGVVSWGNGCAFANFYGVYARVSVLADWVQTHTGELQTTPDLDYKVYLPIIVEE